MLAVCLHQAYTMLVQVTGVKSQDSSRGPSAPYMTSTMLMDAANQLGSNVAATMAAAQGLFEGDVKDTDEGEPLDTILDDSKTAVRSTYVSDKATRYVLVDCCSRRLCMTL